MTGYRRKLLGVLVILTCGVAATLLPMMASSGPEEVREIRLVARDMRFYLEGDDEPNPTIPLRAGERVRILLRNEDAGMRHDFAITDWTIGTRMLEDRSEQDAVTFRVPDDRGTRTYHCTPHPKMMTGTLRVE